MNAPKDFKEYVNECQRLFIDYQGLKYDLTYLIAKDGYTTETAILSDVVVSVKQKYESYRDGYFRKFKFQASFYKELIKSLL
ncbi:hypothetical protein FIA58_009185 [Flavobacterium jejuense]|uniref:Uncharacterized protein n=1 Tax=Flavobacterium jejuense TaxID=1544455 RepID=A0ABX0IRK1_9FLAO|nr:hypothetical protein [Flavobacterium jejuense]NHN25846.1 hypothetical protein [Flavobacterium jejuense]